MSVLSIALGRLLRQKQRLQLSAVSHRVSHGVRLTRVPESMYDVSNKCFYSGQKINIKISNHYFKKRRDNLKVSKTVKQ